MALSKTFGRSLAPGGNRFLLGLPCGVETGEVKLFCVGVWGNSYSALPDRVCSNGGGIGSLNSCFILPGDIG